MSEIIDRTLRKVSKLQKAQEYPGALRLIEDCLRNFPSNPRLLEKKILLNKALLLSKAEIDPPRNVMDRVSALFEKNEWDTLEIVCSRLIEIHQKSSTLLNISAIARRELGLWVQAKERHLAAIKHDPKNAGLHVNYGNTLKRSGEIENAIEAFLSAISINENLADAYNSLATCYEDLGNYEAAERYLNQALSKNPNYGEALYNLGGLKLRSYDFALGWPLREHRWNTRDLHGELQKFEGEPWKGQQTGRLFVWGEQGIGDEVLFASCIKELLGLCETLIFSVSKKSLEIFCRSFPQAVVLDREEIPSDLYYDCQTPLMTALSLLRKSKSCFRNQDKKYLKVDQNLERSWKSELKQKSNGQPVVGISWFSQAKRVGEHRSINLQKLVGSIPKDAFLVNLQYGKVEEEISQLKQSEDRHIEVVEGADVSNCMDHLAALISACDYVVSVDNSTVHFCGALDKECHLFLPFSADWRWGKRHCSSSYWYQSLKLYWQNRPGDWSECLDALRRAKNQPNF